MEVKFVKETDSRNVIVEIKKDFVMQKYLVNPEEGTVIDLEGMSHNIANYRKGMEIFPSYGQKIMGIDGSTGIANCCYTESPCGCKVVGCGTLQFPLAVQHCAKHTQS